MASVVLLSLTLSIFIYVCPACAYPLRLCISVSVPQQISLPAEVAIVTAAALRADASVASSPLLLLLLFSFLLIFLVRPALVGCRIISSKVRISAVMALQFGAYRNG